MSSVLGVALPAKWSATRLKHGTALLNRGTAPSYVDDGPVRVISQAANQDYGLDWERTQFHDFHGDASKLKGYLQPHDLLINSTGTGTLGRIGYFEKGPDTTPCIADTHVTVARTDTEILHPRFGYYWLASRPFQEYIYAALVVGATNQIELNRNYLCDAPLPLPPLEEQRRIADFLDAETQRIGSLTRIRTRQVELLRERTFAQWDSRIRADGDEHGWVPLRRFVQSITDGPFGSSLTSSHYADEGARVIRLGNVARASFRDDDAAFIPLNYYRKLRRHETRPGDLIIAGLGDDDHPLGRSCVVPENISPAIVKADCFRLRLDQSQLTHAYAAWALSSPPVADEVFHLSRGSTRRRINTAVAREINLPIPPIGTQHDTVEELTEIRRNQQVIEKRCNDQLDLLAERRQALVTAAVTGQIDVSTARGVDVS